MTAQKRGKKRDKYRQHAPELLKDIELIANEKKKTRKGGKLRPGGTSAFAMSMHSIIRSRSIFTSHFAPAGGAELKTIRKDTSKKYNSKLPPTSTVLEHMLLARHG